MTSFIHYILSCALFYLDGDTIINLPGLDQSVGETKTAGKLNH